MMTSWPGVVPERRRADRMSRLMRGSVAMEIDDIFVVFLIPASCFYGNLNKWSKDGSKVDACPMDVVNLEHCGGARDL